MQTEKIINWIAIIFIPVVLFVLTPIWDSLFKEKKLLQYSIVRETSALGLGIKIDEWPNLQFVHGENEIDNVISTTILIQNTGKVPIESSEFDSPILINFEEDGKIITHKIVKKIPEDLPIDLKFVGSTLSVNPILLNPGDAFFVKILSKSKLVVKSASARIVGLKRISKLIPHQRSGLYVTLIKATGAGTTSQWSFKKVPIAFLIISCISVAISTFMLLFLYTNSKKIIIKIMLGSMALSMYVLVLFMSSLISKALAGFASERWMDYISMFSVFLLSALIYFQLKRQLSAVVLSVEDDDS